MAVSRALNRSQLDAGEQIFHFEVCDLNELSRDIMADWGYIQYPLLDVL